jgi:hypothetical protein
MNKEQELLIDTAYERFFQIRKSMLMLKPPASEDKLREYIEWYEQVTTQEEFINKCKNDSEFSENWGLKIEERELSLRERMNLCREKLNDTDDGEILLPSDIEYRMTNEWNIPTKQITITYNDKTIESYES